METLLEKLEIFGVNPASEDAILACLLQGEPGLLIGPPGTAKTEICESIGYALREADKKAKPGKPEEWFNCQVYDTSKLNPEDLLGFPNPKAIMEGRMEYVKLPSTVWGKDMVVWDEINRCDKARQSNLFEIIRSRRINGIPTDNKFIFSAMNPFGDTGTQEMSEALTDRHVMYIWFSQFDTLIEEDKHSIIKRVGKHESVGMRHWGNAKYVFDTDDNTVNEKLAEIGNDIKNIMIKAAPIYERLVADMGSNISKLIVRIIAAINAEKEKKDNKIGNLDISGRRAGMMLRALCSLRAVQLAKSEVLNYKVPTLESTLCNGSRMAIPIGISQKASADTIMRIKTIIEETVKAQYAVLFDNSPNADKIYSIFHDKNPITRLESMLSVPNISKLTEQKLWSELYDMCKDTELEAMLGILNQSYNILPPHVEINKDKVTEEKNRKNFVVDAPYADHQDFMLQIQNKVKSIKVLEFCVIRTFLYLSRIGKKHSSADVINNLHGVSKLAETLKAKLTTMKTTNTTDEQQLTDTAAKV